MAKLAFSKLNLKSVISDIKTVEFNDQQIEVKQYLPIEDKITIVNNVLNACQDETNFKNPLKLDMHATLEIIFAYTNLSFTDKQKEDLAKLYDIIISNKFIETIFKAIPQQELSMIFNYINESAKNMYEYRFSAYGILDAVGTDYKNLNLDIDSLQQKLSNGENIELLKDITAKLG